MIRVAQPHDLYSVVDIYNQTIASRLVTADLDPVSYEDKKPWFESHSTLRPIFVYCLDEQVIGWLSFKSFYGRPAYDGTVEISIYVSESARGQGVGRQLLVFAEHHSEQININVLLAFIFSHNHPSIALFTQNGFSQWGVLPDIANMAGQTCSLTILGKHLSVKNSLI